MSASKYKKKNLLINFNKIKIEKTKLKTIKYINSDLIHFEQEHNQRFKHQHKNIKHKPIIKHKKHKLKFKH